MYSAGKVTTVVQSVGSTITGREACTLGVAVGVGLGEADPLGDAELVLELGDAVPFVELGEAVPFVELGEAVLFVELGDGVPLVELGDADEAAASVAEPLADALLEPVAEPLADALLEPVAELLAESVGLALGSGGLGSSATKTSVRFSGVARARTANWPFWIPGRITIRSMVVGAVNLKVSSVPAPRDSLGAEAQKVRESSPTIDVAGLPYPVDDALTLATVAGVPRSGSSQ